MLSCPHCHSVVLASVAEFDAHYQACHAWREQMGYVYTTWQCRHGPHDSPDNPSTGHAPPADSRGRLFGRGFGRKRADAY